MKIQAQITDAWVTDETYTMRLDLSEAQYISLIQAINESNLLEILQEKEMSNIIEKLQSFKMIKRGMKGVAAWKARESLQEITRNKIKEALETLEKEGEKITAYKVAKFANVSYNTAKKYLENKELLRDPHERIPTIPLL